MSCQSKSGDRRKFCQEEIKAEAANLHMDGGANEKPKIDSTSTFCSITRIETLDNLREANAKKSELHKNIKFPLKKISTRKSGKKSKVSVKPTNREKTSADTMKILWSTNMDSKETTV